MRIVRCEEQETNGPNLAEMLERGEVLYYPTSPFHLPTDEDRTFLASQDLGGTIHKNISFAPLTGKLHGNKARSSADIQRMRAIFAAFSSSAINWLTTQFPRYAGHWEIDRCSYRPLEEATRRLRLTARNDLLHVDSFPTRPTNGWRILRVFANVNFTEPRVWITSDPFARLLERYGQQAGLPARGFSFGKMLRLFRPGQRSEYDAFMHRFHNFLKANEAFQERAPKRLWSFPPGSVWLAMTDTASHAVLRGRHALEHSFFIAPDSLALPSESPAALLEKACGFPVVLAA